MNRSVTLTRDEISKLVEQYEIILGNYELQPDNHSSKALKDFLRQWPGIPNYDAKGNWIGSVSNENGWTA
jgi:hypothetical protein